MDSGELDKAGLLEPSAGRCYQDTHDFHIWHKTTCIWCMQIPDTWADIYVLASLTKGDVGDPEQPHIRRSTEKVSKEIGQLSRNCASCHESSMSPAETQENVQAAGFSSWGSQHASIRKPWAALPPYSLRIKNLSCHLLNFFMKRPGHRPFCFLRMQACMYI